MRELFHLPEKYGYKAPLASVSENFDFKAFYRLCNSMDISPTTIAVASDLFIKLQSTDELIASLEYLAIETQRKVSNIRHHLTLLEKSGFVEGEFITTDPIRKRRGKLFKLIIPQGAALTSAPESEEVENFKLVASNTVESINIDQYEDKTRFIELQIVRYLVKAMRTNRKDKSSKISIDIRENSLVKPIKITARAEEGRLVYLPDMSYYAGAITWLIDHIQGRLLETDNIGETFTLPLEPLIALAKDINLSEASGGGYVTNAISALQRISATTFDMADFFEASNSSVVDIELFFKLFRLEAIVTYKDDKGLEKKAAVLQFPRSTITNLVNAIRSRQELNGLLLIQSDIFATNNEIEILFGLWAREHLITGKQALKIYTWNELRESVAPSSKLPEFKRKFSNMIIANHDPTYNAKIHEKITKKITEQVGSTYLSGSKKGERVVEYGRATIQGYLVNIGYSEEQGCSIIAFRRDMSALSIIGQIGANKTSPT